MIPSTAARRVDTDAGESRQRARHQALAAGLVDRAGARLDTAPTGRPLGREQRVAEPDRAAADDQQVDVMRVAARPERSAAFSTRIRTREQRTR